MPAEEDTAGEYGLEFRVSPEGQANWEPVQGADNVTDELMALVRQGDEVGFRELAACVMPVGEIDECWAGARGRLGLASSRTCAS